MQANTALEALEHQLIANDDDSAAADNDSLFILDSSADPTHVFRPTANMLPLTTPIPTQTATDSKSSSTHYGKLHSVTTRNVELVLHAVSNPYALTTWYQCTNSRALPEW